MKCDSFNAKTNTSLFEFRGPVAGAHRAQVGEEGTVCRKVPKNFRRSRIEPH
jgi:hypothetical protein